MHHYITVLNNYAVFTGRATRSEYWYFYWFNFLITIGLVVIGFFLGKGFETLATLYYLAMIVPSLAVGIRRLHDVGKSGWMLLINLLPFIGAIWFFILMVRDSQPGDNQYGPNPKVIGSAAVLTPPVL